MTVEQMSRLDAALDYARRGLPVFPVHTIDEDGRCTCGDAACDDVGKHPIADLAPNGFEHATLDEQVIRSWWSLTPQPNVGIRTGKGGSGWLVIDVDGDGEDAWHELERAHPLPRTIESISGGGGRHVVFRRPPWLLVRELGNTTGALPDGVHVRCDGGYIVAPPSVHASGRRYEWSVDGHPDEVGPAPLPAWLLDTIRGRGNRSARALRDEAGHRIPEGKRNTTLARYGGAMRRYGFDEAAIRMALIEHNRSHCDPPLHDREVERVAASVSRYAPSEPILATPAHLAAVAASDLIIRADTVQSRAIRWAWTGRLPFGYLVVQTGNEGLGKSAFAAWMLARLTRGELDGELRGEPVTVLVVAGEDGIADTWKPRLALADADMTRIGFLDLDRLGVDWNVRDGADTIAEAAASSRSRVLFIDALLDHMPAPKAGESINSPTFVRTALNPLKQLVRRLDLAGLYSMHPPKSKGGEFRDMVQASQAFAAVPRTGLLFAYHPDDHEQPEQQRRRVLLRGKGNLGRDPGALEFRIVGEHYRSDDGRVTERERVVDVQSSPVRLADLLADSVIGERKQSKQQHAADLLRGALVDGEWHEASPLLARLYALDLSAPTIRRAGQRIGVERRKRPGETDGPWEWRLPTSPSEGVTGMFEGVTRGVSARKVTP